MDCQLIMGGYLRHVWRHRFGLSIFFLISIFPMDFNSFAMQIFPFINFPRFLVIFHFAIHPALFCYFVLSHRSLYKNCGTDKFIKNCEKYFSPKFTKN